MILWQDSTGAFVKNDDGSFKAGTDCDPCCDGACTNNTGCTGATLHTTCTGAKYTTQRLNLSVSTTGTATFPAFLYNPDAPGYQTATATFSAGLTFDRTFPSYVNHTLVQHQVLVQEFANTGTNWSTAGDGVMLTFSLTGTIKDADGNDLDLTYFSGDCLATIGFVIDSAGDVTGSVKVEIGMRYWRPGTTTNNDNPENYGFRIVALFPIAADTMPTICEGETISLGVEDVSYTAEIDEDSNPIDFDIGEVTVSGSETVSVEFESLTDELDPSEMPCLLCPRALTVSGTQTRFVSGDSSDTQPSTSFDLRLVQDAIVACGIGVCVWQGEGMAQVWNAGTSSFDTIAVYGSIQIGYSTSDPASNPFASNFSDFGVLSVYRTSDDFGVASFPFKVDSSCPLGTITVQQFENPSAGFDDDPRTTTSNTLTIEADEPQEGDPTYFCETCNSCEDDDSSKTLIWHSPDGDKSVTVSKVTGTPCVYGDTDNSLSVGGSPLKRRAKFFDDEGTGLYFEFEMACDDSGSVDGEYLPVGGAEGTLTVG